ncbi:MAG: hypothetical protein Q9181_001531 [Wetmoreana brouardii]
MAAPGVGTNQVHGRTSIPSRSCVHSCWACRDAIHTLACLSDDGLTAVTSEPHSLGLPPPKRAYHQENTVISYRQNPPSASHQHSLAVSTTAIRQANDIIMRYLWEKNQRLQIDWLGKLSSTRAAHRPLQSCCACRSAPA